MVTRLRRRGFTLVELLVVIAIIGILIALLLPALNSVRESARRSLCSANCKQLALGVNAFYDAQRTFPKSGAQGDGKSSVKTGASGKITGITPGATGDTHPYGFLVHLLPFVEQGHVYDTIDFTKGPFNAVHSDEAALIVPIFKCPSYVGPSTTGDATTYANTPGPSIGNYKALSAVTKMVLDNTPNLGSGTDGSAGAINPLGEVNSLQATSQTILIVETKEERFAVWFDGATAGLYGFNDDPALTGSNPPVLPGLGSGSEVQEVALNNLHLTPAENYSDVPTAGFGGKTMKWGASSEHVGATNHSFGDTNTRTIPNDVDPSVYEALITRKAKDNGQIANWFSE